jgi:hypothetical protein
MRLFVSTTLNNTSMFCTIVNFVCIVALLSASFYKLNNTYNQSDEDYSVHFLRLQQIEVFNIVLARGYIPYKNVPSDSSQREEEEKKNNSII